MLIQLILLVFFVAYLVVTDICNCWTIFGYGFKCARDVTEQLRELILQNKDMGRQLQDWTTIRIQLESERDNLSAELAEARDIIRDLQGRLDTATGSLSQLRSDLERRLHERESELENLR